MASFKDLTTWQRAMDLTDCIYSLTKKLPREELYGLSDQMRRAVVSIPSNIAEGQRRNSDKEFLHFLAISLGSCAELETQLLICKRQQLAPTEDLDNAIELCNDVGKLLNRLIASIKRKEENRRS